jgi:hypothetical protein
MAKATPKTHENIAREALLRYFEKDTSGVDHLLAWLWTEGFKIVPLDDEDIPDEP